MLKALLPFTLALTVCLAPSAAAQSATEEVLPAGTIVQCTLDEPSFSSRSAQIGDPVLCHVGALATFGHAVFPRGAYLAGHFQEYRDPGRLVGKGWIELAFDRLILPGPVTLPLSTKVIALPSLRVDREGRIHGRGHPKRDALAWAVPILWPVKVVTLPARGPRPMLKGEVRITLRLLEDVEVPAPAMTRGTISSMPALPLLKPSGTDASLATSRAASAASVVATASPAHHQANIIAAELVDYPSAQITLLILKGGSGYLARDYWLEGGQLHFLTVNGESKLLPVGRLDLEDCPTQPGTQSRLCASHPGCERPLTLGVFSSRVQMPDSPWPAILDPLGGGTRCRRPNN